MVEEKWNASLTLGGLVVRDSRMAVLPMLLFALFFENALAQSPPDKSELSRKAEHRFVAEEEKVDTTIVKPCLAENAQTANQIREKIARCGCLESVKQSRTDLLSAAMEKDTAACRIRGADALLAYIQAERLKSQQRLGSLRSQFQDQVVNYRGWMTEAQHGQDDAAKQIKDLFLLSIVDALLEWGKTSSTASIDRMIVKADSIREVPYVKMPELQAFVLNLKEQLRGRSREEAKAIVLAELDAQKKDMFDAMDLADQAVGEKLTDVAPASDAGFAKSLDDGYGRIVTILKIASTHEVGVIGGLGKLAGLLALAPAGLKASLSLLSNTVDKANIEALDHLRGAAESDRAATSAWLELLTDEERTLKERREELYALEDR